ncbi:protease-4 [Litorimonas taeanensis]|uniref:Protease-4 n=1 Tax=Litorimonas taeanensis TaxID=568099 RepID=A0A420WIM7_9PROT|nr:signal peptide peptidase SppA [Litorimonas taeanensis]RKQ70874.1 protease-4 [Litorimonas taeanensis]
MRQFLITVFGVVVGIIAFFFLIFVFVFGLGIIGSLSASMKPKPNQVLSFDMRAALPDQGMGDTLFAESTGVVDIVRALNAAKTDDRVKGLFIRADRYGITPASAEELRLAILDFKTSGKFVVAHAQGFESPSVFPYMTIAAADEIWMQDTTGFAVAGIHSETEFFGGVMEKFDVQPQFEQFYEYKNAVNTYTEKGFTEAHKESTTSFLTSLYDSAIAHIATDREMTVSGVKQFLNASPHSAEEAMTAGFVDKMGFIEIAKDYVKEKAGGEDTELLAISDYTIDSHYGAPVIAYIGGEGAVVTGDSSHGGPFGGDLAMGSDTLAKAFDDAAKDKAVKAIVFRVSSPGGSPSASDQILAAAERAQEAGKPVIISMGKYAASGGYYVSATADKIVAMPTSITGSIGVYGGKIAFEDTFAKVGYNIEAITIGGDYAGALSADTPFTESQREGFRGQLTDIYEDFINRVSTGRDLPIETVKDIAKGRVWTGEQAKERGLVDELGGFLKAVDVAKELAEIDADKEVRLKRFPRIPTAGEQLQNLFSGAEQAKADIEALKAITALPEVQAALRAHRAAQKREALHANIPSVE